MFKLKLTKGLSYSGAICASKASPLVSVKDKKQADAAVESGYFELVSTTKEEPKQAAKEG